MKTIVGLFDNYHEAEQTVRDLELAGHSREKISIVANSAARQTVSTRAPGHGETTGAAEGAGTGAVIGGVTGGAAGLIASLTGLAIPGIGPVLMAGPILATLTGAGVGAVAGGLVGGLTSAGVPDEHAHFYAEGVRRGGTLVTVTAEDDEAARIMEIMNRHHPVDIEQRASTWRQSGFAVPGSSTRVGGETATVGGETATVGGETATVGGETTVSAASRSGHDFTPDAQARPLREGQQAIPVVEEELRVGKREVETGGVRVNTRMEERPVEEQVTLREERVTVDRQPADRPATAADFNQAFKGGTIELTERAEEAVVQKEARVVEEVVVNKEAAERIETVHDTVRRTDVDIQPVEVGSGAAASAEFDALESDFRTNYTASHRGSEYGFDKAKPAYRYGYELASDRGHASSGSGEWSSIESDARSRWEQRNPGTWDKFKDAARFAYDRARSKMHT